MFTNIKLSPANSLVINVDYDKGLIFISPDLKSFSTLGQVSVKEVIGACKLARKWREGKLYWDNVRVTYPFYGGRKDETRTRHESRQNCKSA